MSDASISDYRFGRTRMAVGKAIAAAICVPKLWLGKRRHNNYCDECGEYCGRYAMQKLDFPFEVGADAVSDRSKLEKIRGMVNADYRRVCLECGHELQQDGDDDD